MTEIQELPEEKVKRFEQVKNSWKQPLFWLWLIVFGVLAAKTLFSLNIMWQIFNFAFQVDESESMIVSETVMLSKGVDIFARPTADVFISAPYTPFYYWLNWPFLHLFGASFKPGRAISFLAAAGIALLIYRFTLAYTRQRLGKAGQFPAILATFAWCSLGLVAFWGGAVKPDMSALFFNVLGLYLLFITPSNAPRTQNLVIAAVCFALAAFTKQTAFAGVMVGLVWLALNGQFKKLGWFGGLYLALAFVPMLILNLLSNGGFWWHIVTVHELPWNAQNYWKFFSAYLQNYQFFALLALGLVIFWLLDIVGASKTQKWAEFRQNPATFLLLYAGAGLGAGLSSGTYGGNHNHLLEFSAAGCIALGAVFGRLNSWWQAKDSVKWRWQRWLLVPALALIFWQGAGLFAGEARLKALQLPVPAAVWEGLQGQFYNKDWLGLEYRAPLDNQKKRLAEVAAFMNNDTAQLIYADNVSLMLATTKKLFTTDPFTQTHATFYGRWDESKLVRMVEKGEFGLIVLRQAIQPRAEAGQSVSDIYFSPGLAQAVQNNYRLACRDIAFIYVPKSRSDFKGC